MTSHSVYSPNSIGFIPWIVLRPNNIHITHTILYALNAYSFEVLWFFIVIVMHNVSFPSCEQWWVNMCMRIALNWNCIDFCVCFWCSTGNGHVSPFSPSNQKSTLTCISYTIPYTLYHSQYKHLRPWKWTNLIKMKIEVKKTVDQSDTDLQTNKLMTWRIRRINNETGI